VKGEESIVHLAGQSGIKRPAYAGPGIREALSVHLAGKIELDYAEEDREILKAIGFRPDRASREDNRAKYSPEQS